VLYVLTAAKQYATYGSYKAPQYATYGSYPRSVEERDAAPEAMPEAMPEAVAEASSQPDAEIEAREGYGAYKSYGKSVSCSALWMSVAIKADRCRYATYGSYGPSKYATYGSYPRDVAEAVADVLERREAEAADAAATYKGYGKVRSPCLTLRCFPNIVVAVRQLWQIPSPAIICKLHHLPPLRLSIELS
jgi:hypothetical protein